MSNVVYLAATHHVIANVQRIILFFKSFVWLNSAQHALFRGQGPARH